MSNEFDHLIPLDKEMKDQVRMEGFIALDANVLLDLYRLPPTEADKVLSVLGCDKVHTRLWVPHQAALEFYRNRLDVIRGEVAKANHLRDEADRAFQSIADAAKSAITTFKNTDFRKYHPFADKSKWARQIEKRFANLLDFTSDDCIKSIRSEYENSRAGYPVTITSDPLLPKIQTLINGHIGAPLDAEEQAEVGVEAERRIKEKIPPGYKDRKKDGTRPYGDYIVFRQILKKAENENNHCLLVSNENHEDWLLIVEGNTLGARPELRKEFIDVSNKELHIDSLSSFTQWASQKYEIDIPDKETLNDAIKAVERSGGRNRTASLATTPSISGVMRAMSVANRKLSPFEAVAREARESLKPFADTSNRAMRSIEAVAREARESAKIIAEHSPSTHMKSIEESVRPVIEDMEAYQRSVSGAINMLRVLEQSQQFGQQPTYVGDDPQLSSDHTEVSSPKEMAEWFLSNYKDPSDGVPYCSEDGGYQYINGGPYDASDILWSKFPDSREEDIQKALAEIEMVGGPDWVGINDY